LEKTKTIYLNEKECQESAIEDRQAYRTKNIAPLMKELHEWAEKNQYDVLPKSPIGKAIGIPCSIFKIFLARFPWDEPFPRDWSKNPKDILLYDTSY